MPQLVFFPWIELEDDIDIGGYSLKRFKPGSLPGVDEEFRATLDSVLAPVSRYFQQTRRICGDTESQRPGPD